MHPLHLRLFMRIISHNENATDDKKKHTIFLLYVLDSKTKRIPV